MYGANIILFKYFSKAKYFYRVLICHIAANSVILLCGTGMCGVYLEYEQCSHFVEQAWNLHSYL